MTIGSLICGTKSARGSAGGGGVTGALGNGGVTGGGIELFIKSERITSVRALAALPKRKTQGTIMNCDPFDRKKAAVKPDRQHKDMAVDVDYCGC